MTVAFYVRGISTPGSPPRISTTSRDDNGGRGSNPVVRSTLSNTNAKCPGTESLRGALVVPFVLPLNSGVRVLLILSPRPWPRGRTHRSKVQFETRAVPRRLSLPNELTDEIRGSHRSRS